MIFLSILILIVAIALPSIKKGINSLLITRISSIIFIYSGVLAFNALYIQSIESGIGIYSGLLQVSIISQLLDVLLLFLGAFILMSWPLITTNYYNETIGWKVLFTDNNKNLHKLPKKIYNFVGEYTPRTEYSIIVLFSALGSSLLISSADLLTLYLSIELQSLSLYILASLYREYESATAAGLKYFLLGALASCFILLGCGLIYSFTGLTNFESIYSFISVTIPQMLIADDSVLTIANIDNKSSKLILGVSLGFILIFSGFLFKMAAAPLHSWSPCVYDDSPTQVTIWLTIIPKIALLTLILELSNGLSLITYLNVSEVLSFNLMDNILNITYNLSYVLKTLILISAFLSLIIGTIVGLAQIRIKRLLAYSTIAHLGFMLLALAINTEQSIHSFIFYIIQYSLTNLNIFLIILAFGYILNKPGLKILNNSRFIKFFDFDINFLFEYRGQVFTNIVLSWCLIICLLSMSGIPPLLGFFSKQYVLLSATESGYWFMAFVAILTSVISASYYLRIVVLLVTPTEDKINKVNTEMTLTKEESLNKNINNKNYINNLNIYMNKFINKADNDTELLTSLQSYLISTLTLFILLFIFKPTILLNSTYILALSLFNS